MRRREGGGTPTLLLPNLSEASKQAGALPQLPPAWMAALTFTPGVEEDVGVCVRVPGGAQDSVGRPHSHIHAELAHDAVRGRLDLEAHGPVFSHHHLGTPPAFLQLPHHRDRDVGALIFHGILACRRTDGHR